MKVKYNIDFLLVQELLLERIKTCFYKYYNSINLNLEDVPRHFACDIVKVFDWIIGKTIEYIVLTIKASQIGIDLCRSHD
jgi:hypothetical protein